jgi:hypothetical protein
MPKTSMNEDHLSMTWKNNVGVPWKVTTMQSEPIAKAMYK